MESLCILRSMKYCIIIFTINYASTKIFFALIKSSFKELMGLEQYFVASEVIKILFKPGVSKKFILRATLTPSLRQGARYFFKKYLKSKA